KSKNEPALRPYTGGQALINYTHYTLLYRQRQFIFADSALLFLPQYRAARRLTNARPGYTMNQVSRKIKEGMPDAAQTQPWRAFDRPSGIYLGHERLEPGVQD